MNEYIITVVGEIDHRTYEWEHRNAWNRGKDFVTDASIGVTAAAECMFFGPKANDGKRQKYLPTHIEWLNDPKDWEEAVDLPADASA